MCLRPAMLALALASLVPVPVLAGAFDDHVAQETYGAWTVICVEFDDMGGVTLEDCVALGPEGVVLGLAESNVFAARIGAAPGDTLRIGGSDLPLTGCPDGRCDTGRSEAALFGPLAEIALMTEGQRKPVSLAGLGDALVQSVRLSE